MSTSPSWFDQEKFSRLVKKVGSKPVTEPLPPAPTTDPQNNRGEGLASTARISLTSKPQSLLSEHRGLPMLPRRTSPLPSLKSIFAPAIPQPAPTAPAEPATETAPETDAQALLGRANEEDLVQIWHKMGLLNEELARAILERDQAVNEGALLREQLNRAEEERGEAQTEPGVAQAAGLRAQLLLARDTSKQPTDSTGKTQELNLLLGERDEARREYFEIRKQFESLKHEQAPQEDSVKSRKEWEQQIEELKQQIAERDQEIAKLKATAAGTGQGDEKHGEETTSLREQLAKTKEEASIAQRGLALSQKALQQTRDTLREATEGTSLSRHNFDNLKNECAILAQQNTVLQTQNDQLSRDLSAARLKLTSRS
jgi:hypothetical protein